MTLKLGSSRQLLILIDDQVRARAISMMRGLPDGTRVTFQDPKRTLDQNAHFWALLTDVAEQVEHCGRKYDTDAWKHILLHAFGREMKFLPGIDQKTFVPVGLSSSDLSKEEMAEMIEFIRQFGAERGVVFHEPEIETDGVR